MLNQFDDILQNEGNITFRKRNTKNKNIPSSVANKFANNDGVLFNDELIDNIMFLKCKTEKRAVEYMKKRFQNQEFYTWCGQALVAVHPFCDFKEETETTTPSIKALISKLWFRLSHRVGLPNQAILISGDSGSGKTYSANLAIKTILEKQDDFQDSLLQRISYSSPLLATFGNARTIHNSNSSRFGKLLKLQYDSGKIRGAYIETYLLEKSRVSDPDPYEGNFHIFQQFLDDNDEETLSLFYISKNVNYKVAPVVNLSPSKYKDTITALEVLQIRHIEDILCVLSIIINLGNVNFEQIGEHFEIPFESQGFLAKAAKLFKTDCNTLSTLLTVKTIFCKSYGKRDSMYSFPCGSREDCEDRKKCIIRVMYEKLFLWLVKKINEQIYCDGSFQMIGILDMYGFEVFDHNGFEQLCINYANERLHCCFIKDYLIYHKPNFSGDTIDTDEYSERLRLLDGVPSVFSILNEESVLKRYKQDARVNLRLVQHLTHYAHFESAKSNFSTMFSIRHYGGIVKYDAEKMVAKNRDKVPKEVLHFLKTSAFDFIREIITEEPPGECTAKKTLLLQFKRSLDDMIKTLNTGDVHYIKCLKSNPYQIPNIFNDRFFAEQMKINGIFDVMHMVSKKYPIRLIKTEVEKSFFYEQVLLLKDIIQNEVCVDETEIRMSETFFEVLNKCKKLKKSIAARKIQKAWKKLYWKKQDAAVKIQRFFRITMLKRQTDTFIDISVKSNSINANYKLEHQEHYCMAIGTAKVLAYIETLPSSFPFKGDMVSLLLERQFENLETKHFSRTIFRGDRVVSKMRIPTIPIRIHFRKTCIPFSYLMPKSELPRGLEDIL